MLDFEKIIRRRRYNRPELVHYGSVRKLTQGSMSNGNDGAGAMTKDPKTMGAAALQSGRTTRVPLRRMA